MKSNSNTDIGNSPNPVNDKDDDDDDEGGIVVDEADAAVDDAVEVVGVGVGPRE